jgi:hypothetical protein
MYMMLFRFTKKNSLPKPRRAKSRKKKRYKEIFFKVF